MAASAFVASSSKAADLVTGSRHLVLYTAPAHETFINNDDDEARGEANNPFGTRIHTATGTENKSGPFPGDEAVFSFDLYATSALKTKIGSATYTCQYYFNANAFCDTSFQLNGGTLVGAGVLNFNGTMFSIAITGGFGKYGRLTGDVQASPSGNRAQRLSFVLL